MNVKQYDLLEEFYSPKTLSQGHDNAKYFNNTMTATEHYTADLIPVIKVRSRSSSSRYEQTV